MNFLKRTAPRLLVAVFCWMTAAYAFIVSSAFAYLQFVRPRVFPWIGQFSDWHARLSLVWLGVVALVLWSDLRPARDGESRRARPLAIGCLAVCGAACAWNLFNPVLPGLSSGGRAIGAGVAALVPLLWISAVDHAAGISFLTAQAPPDNERDLRGYEGRLFAAFAGTALFLTMVYGMLSSRRLINAFEPDLLLAGLVRAQTASLTLHLAILIVAFLAIALIVRSTRRSFLLQYAALQTAFAVCFAVVFARLVGDALSFYGVGGAIAAAATALSVVGVWTGVNLRRLAAEGGRLASGLDVFFGLGEAGRADGPERVRAARAWKFVAIGLLAYVLVLLSERADWDFIVLQIGVLIVWFCSFSCLYQATPFVPRVNSWTIAALSVAALAAVAAIGAAAGWRHAIDRYAVYNPSFRVAALVITNQTSPSPGFDQYLRNNTGLTDVEVQPIDIDLAPNLQPATGPKPPIFLFVIDSLRADYLAAYNAAVRFTPRIAEFAAESIVFRNAFTAFGGTGLSLPAIWSGSSLVHKQYVKPFHPMNTLEKLLDANGYHRLMSLDSVMQPLLEPATASRTIDELDRGRNVMDYEFCQTLEELQGRLHDLDQSRPVFAYSLPQDIHMSRLPRTVESGEEFRSFHAPYATKVHTLDGCFGRFIDALKRLKMYEKSVIVLTSDHGEMLGEDGRFGHSYHLFPQIIQVPLIVHLPAKLAASLDRDAVSRSIDITPTLYSVLGYAPARPTVLAGRSLVAVDARQSQERRRDTYVTPASYGAVYAALRHNGRRLYIADGIRGGDQAFERDRTGRWSQVEVSPGLRALNQWAIRRHVDEIARQYHLQSTKW